MPKCKSTFFSGNPFAMLDGDGQAPQPVQQQESEDESEEGTPQRAPQQASRRQNGNVMIVTDDSGGWGTVSKRGGGKQQKKSSPNRGAQGEESRDGGGGAQRRQPQRRRGERNAQRGAGGSSKPAPTKRQMLLEKLLERGQRGGREMVLEVIDELENDGKLRGSMDTNINTVRQAVSLRIKHEADQKVMLMQDDDESSGEAEAEPEPVDNSFQQVSKRGKRKPMASQSAHGLSMKDFGVSQAAGVDDGKRRESRASIDEEEDRPQERTSRVRNARPKEKARKARPSGDGGLEDQTSNFDFGASSARGRLQEFQQKHDEDSQFVEKFYKLDCAKLLLCNLIRQGGKAQIDKPLSDLMKVTLYGDKANRGQSYHGKLVKQARELGNEASQCDDSVRKTVVDLMSTVFDVQKVVPEGLGGGYVVKDKFEGTERPEVQEIKDPSNELWKKVDSSTKRLNRVYNANKAQDAKKNRINPVSSAKFLNVYRKSFDTLSKVQKDTDTQCGKTERGLMDVQKQIGTIDVRLQARIRPAMEKRAKITREKANVEAQKRDLERQLAQLERTLTQLDLKETGAQRDIDSIEQAHSPQKKALEDKNAMYTDRIASLKLSKRCYAKTHTFLQTNYETLREYGQKVDTRTRVEREKKQNEYLNALHQYIKDLVALLTFTKARIQFLEKHVAERQQRMQESLQYLGSSSNLQRNHISPHDDFINAVDEDKRAADAIIKNINRAVESLSKEITNKELYNNQNLQNFIDKTISAFGESHARLNINRLQRHQQQVSQQQNIQNQGFLNYGAPSATPLAIIDDSNYSMPQQRQPRRPGPQQPQRAARGLKGPMPQSKARSSPEARRQMDASMEFGKVNTSPPVLNMSKRGRGRGRGPKRGTGRGTGPTSRGGANNYNQGQTAAPQAQPQQQQPKRTARPRRVERDASPAPVEPTPTGATAQPTTAAAPTSTMGAWGKPRTGSTNAWGKPSPAPQTTPAQQPTPAPTQNGTTNDQPKRNKSPRRRKKAPMASTQPAPAEDASQGARNNSPRKAPMRGRGRGSRGGGNNNTNNASTANTNNDQQQRSQRPPRRARPAVPQAPTAPTGFGDSSSPMAAGFDAPPTTAAFDQPNFNSYPQQPVAVSYNPPQQQYQNQAPPVMYTQTPAPETQQQQQQPVSGFSNQPPPSNWGEQPTGNAWGGQW